MKTHDSSYGDMTDDDASGIQIVVTSGYGETCTTKPLNNVGEVNWVKGEVDYFDDAVQLDQCFNFRVPGHVSCLYISGQNCVYTQLFSKNLVHRTLELCVWFTREPTHGKGNGWMSTLTLEV